MRIFSPGPRSEQGAAVSWRTRGSANHRSAAQEFTGVESQEHCCQDAGSVVRWAPEIVSRSQEVQFILSAFIVEPLPDIVYTDNMETPLQMFLTKVLIPQLNTSSAYHKLGVRWPQALLALVGCDSSSRSQNVSPYVHMSYLTTVDYDYMGLHGLQNLPKSQPLCLRDLLTKRYDSVCWSCTGWTRVLLLLTWVPPLCQVFSCQRWPRDKCSVRCPPSSPSSAMRWVTNQNQVFCIKCWINQSEANNLDHV